MVTRIGQRAAPRRKTFFKEWREHRGLTQEQLAERLGTNKSGVSKVETGVSGYSQSSLEAWAEALGCEPWDLLARNPQSKDSIQQLLERASPDVLSAVMTLIKPN